LALHGLAHMTLGVTDLGAADQFYEEFGLTPTGDHRYASSEGGEQLRLVATPVRGLVEFACAADDVDDLSRIRAAAIAVGIEVSDDGDDIVMREPIVGIGVRVTVKARIAQTPSVPPPLNGPALNSRGSTRAPAIFERDGAVPRRLGHVLYTSTDFDASRHFLENVLGFRTSDVVPNAIAFTRCSTDHHNVGLINAPVPFFHHSSWQVDDVDMIGHGAHKLLAVDPTRNAWGLGRHFLGSNYFWYFRDPSGNMAEYFADLDQIDEAEWTTGTWGPEKSLYSWGPPVPPDFVIPPDFEELSTAYAASKDGSRT
jgi:catechol 2,3-dioxygenase-like lactoylglutathione lyase family enzyme